MKRIESKCDELKMTLKFIEQVKTGEYTEVIESSIFPRMDEPAIYGNENNTIPLLSYCN